MIRKLMEADAPQLQVINRDSLGYDLSLGDTLQQLIKILGDHPHHYLLVWEDDETATVQGYLHAEVYDSLYAPTLFNVMALAVAKEAQHQGIGRQLMQALENEAHRRNYAGIRLNSGGDRHLNGSSKEDYASFLGKPSKGQ